MKGLILAGGSGTRLYPITQAISKQLMPIFDKPMIYYPLSTLMMAGINQIAIITTAKDQSNFINLLGDGSQLGCRFEYIVQPKPEGLAQAFLLAKDFIGKDHCCLILGDNIFYGSGLEQTLRNSVNQDGGIIFATQVVDPQRYGVVEFDSNYQAISIQEKPKIPRSNYAIPGIYFYDNLVVQAAENATFSERGELEITEIHNFYLKKNKLKVQVLDRGIAWLDTGTFESMNQAAQFVQVIEERQGIKIGCIEEVAFKMNFIDSTQIKRLAQPLLKSGYGQYLMNLTNP